MASRIDWLDTEKLTLILDHPWNFGNFWLVGETWLTLTALETTLSYARTNINMLLNTNISFLERTINIFIAQGLAIVK